MTFDPLSISQDDLLALRKAAEATWAGEALHPQYSEEQDSSEGRCYATSFWLTRRFGGFLGHDSGGHYVWVSPDKQYVIDLTCDKHMYVIYKSIEHPIFQGVVVQPLQTNEHAEQFADRADAMLASA